MDFQHKQHAQIKILFLPKHFKKKFKNKKIFNENFLSLNTILPSTLVLLSMKHQQWRIESSSIVSEKKSGRKQKSTYTERRN